MYSFSYVWFAGYPKLFIALVISPSFLNKFDCSCFLNVLVYVFVFGDWYDLKLLQKPGACRGKSIETDFSEESVRQTSSIDLNMWILCFLSTKDKRHVNTCERRDTDLITNRRVLIVLRWKFTIWSTCEGEDYSKSSVPQFKELSYLYEASLLSIFSSLHSVFEKLFPGLPFARHDTGTGVECGSGYGCFNFDTALKMLSFSS